MNKAQIVLSCLLLASGSLAAHTHAGQIGEEMPDAQKIRFCERVRDFALQAYYDRDKGRPIRLFGEDGSPGPRITNLIVKHIYAEPKIASPQAAEAYGRAACNEMMGSSGGKD